MQSITLNRLSELKTLKQETAQKKFIKEGLKNPVCAGCGEKIEQDEKELVIYYVCYYHKLVFCYHCARNGEKRVVKKTNTVGCHNRYYLSEFYNKRYYNLRDDCIYEKKVILPRNPDEKDILTMKKEVNNGNNKE